jgi:hypothetical protein
MIDLANNVWAALSKDNKNTEQVKAQFSVPYVVNTYRQYLQPAHLTEDRLHMHWQYWHENALKVSVK